MLYNDNSCSNCGGIRIAGSTLCVDCLEACRVRVDKNYSLTMKGLERNIKNIAGILVAKNKEIEDLKCKLQIRTLLYQEIKEKYQGLLAAAKEEVCKKRVG